VLSSLFFVFVFVVAFFFVVVVFSSFCRYV